MQIRRVPCSHAGRRVSMPNAPCRPAEKLSVRYPLPEFVVTIDRPIPPWRRCTRKATVRRNGVTPAQPALRRRFASGPRPPLVEWLHLYPEATLAGLGPPFASMARQCRRTSSGETLPNDSIRPGRSQILRCYLTLSSPGDAPACACPSTPRLVLGLLDTIVVCR